MTATKWVWDVVAQAFVQPQSTWAQIDALVASGGGMSNPMSALGDIIYEDAVPAPNRLAGNTNNDNRFLRSKASGGVAQVPAWQRILCPDIDADTNNSMFFGGGGGSITTGSLNVSVGYTALNALSSGAANMAIGAYAATLLTTQSHNVAMGYNSMQSSMGNFNTALGSGSFLNGTGDNNACMGYQAMYGASSGSYNTIIGTQGLYTPGTAAQNVVIGFQAGGSCSGDNNVLVGLWAGYTCGTGNVMLGWRSGFYETGSNKLFIDNAQRASEADGRAKALIYGIFAAATTDQYLTINGYFFLPTIKSGANQGASGAAAGELWKTASHLLLPDNVVMIGV